MVDAVGPDLGLPMSLGEDESALDDRLHVEGEALCGPVGLDPMLAHGSSDDPCKRGDVLGDALLARVAQLRVGRVRFLNDRPGETGKIRELPGQQGLAECQIGEQLIERIRLAVVCCAGKDAVRVLAPVRRSCKCEVVLAVEVMKEAALRHAGRRADIVDARRIVALRANDSQRGVEKLRLGFMRQSGHGELYPCINPPYRLVGMLSSRLSTTKLIFITPGPQKENPALPAVWSGLRLN